MNFLIVLFTLLTVFATVAVATPNNDVKYRIMLRQAMLDIDRMQYDKAIVKLLEVRANTEENANVNHLLGKCYLYGEVSYEKAVFYLSRAAEDATEEYEEWDLDETRAPLETFYLLAKAYENTELFDMAAEYYAMFLDSLEGGKVNASSRTYAIINQSATNCRIAAANQAATSDQDGLVQKTGAK
jgi:tetratricopeptide (TPR) repeat protein